MLTAICVLFNGKTVQGHSRGIYTPEWVNKLCRGITRNATQEVRLVCLTDFASGFDDGIERYPLVLPNRDYYSIMEIFRPTLEIERGFFVGLDTIITGSIDDILGYDGPYGLINNVPRESLKYKDWYEFWPRIPFGNGVVMWNRESGWALWDTYVSKPHAYWNATTVMPWHKDGSEMVFMNEQAPCPPDALDDLYPGQIVSFRRDVRDQGQGDARIVYFHGSSKPHLYPDHPVVKEHWV